MRKLLLLCAALMGCASPLLPMIDEADGYHASATSAIGGTLDEVDLLAAHLCRRAALYVARTARDAAELPRGTQRQSLEARASRATAKMRAACRLAGVPPVQAGLPGVAVPAPEPDLARPQPVADMREPTPADGGR